MTFPFDQTLQGTAGANLTAASVGADSIGGGVGGNAKYRAGGMNVPGLTAHAEFTASRRLNNNVSGDPDFIVNRIVLQSAANPSGTCPIFKLTSGGVNFERGGFRVLTSGKLEILSGFKANGVTRSETDNRVCDDRIWAVIHVWDRLGVLSPGAPFGTGARQWLFLLRENGDIEEVITSDIEHPSDVIDGTYYGVCNDSLTWTVNLVYAACSTVWLYYKLKLDRVRIGPSGPSSMEMMVQAQGADSFRVVSQQAGTDLTRTSSTATPDMFGHALVSVADLAEPDTGYNHLIQAQAAGSSTWETIAERTSRTARKRGSPIRDLVFDWTCHKQEGTGVLFPRLIARYGQPGLYINKGDYHYDNPGTNPVDDNTPWQWIKCWMRQDELVAGIKDAWGVGMVTSADDHDIGVINAQFSGPSIDKAFAAQKMCMPTFDTPGMPSTGTIYGAVQRGETMHVITQFTSQYRSDPDDTDVDWNPGDPRPTKTPFGTAQDDCLEALYTSSGDGGYDGPNGYVAYVLYLNKGWLGDKDGPGWGGKNDHHAFYPAHRKWLGWLIGQRRGVIITGDNHMFGYRNVCPWSSLAVIHNAGAHRDSGNTSWDPEMDETWPVDPDDNDTNLQGAAVIESMRLGSTYTLRVAIFDADLDDERFVIERSWPGVNFVGDHGWFVNGYSLETRAWNVRNAAAGWGLPPKRGQDKIIAGRHGRKFQADKRYDQNVIDLSMWAVGAEQDGVIPVTRPESVLVRENLDELMRLFADSNDDGLLNLTRIDELGERRAWAEVTEAIDMSSFYDRVAEFVVSLNIPDAFFEDVTTTVEELDFDSPDAEPVTLWFTTTAGASAPVQDAKIELIGGFDNPLISDPVGRSSVRYLGSVNPTHTLTVDCANFTVDENGLNKLRLFEQRGVGPFLILKPRKSDGSYGLRINVDSNPGAGAKVRLTVRRRHFLA